MVGTSNESVPESWPLTSGPWNPPIWWISPSCQVRLVDLKLLLKSYHVWTSDVFPNTTRINWEIPTAPTNGWWWNLKSCPSWSCHLRLPASTSVSQPTSVGFQVLTHVLPGSQTMPPCRRSSPKSWWNPPQHAAAGRAASGFLQGDSTGKNSDRYGN